MSETLQVFDRLVAGNSISSDEITLLRNIIGSVKSTTTYASVIEQTEDEVKDLLSTTFDSIPCMRKIEVKGLMPGTTGKIMMPINLRTVLFKAGREWTFNCKTLQSATGGKAISLLICTYFQDNDLFDKLNIDPRNLRKFGRLIEMTYSQAPYHNSTHVASVLQCLHMILTSGEVYEAMSTWCIKNSTEPGLILAAAYIAAAGHDAGHRGVTNDFLIKSKDETADEFNDRSCNENYHCRLTWRALQDSNVLQNLSSEAIAFVRCVIMNCILKTDMKDHFHVLHDFELLKMSKLAVSDISLDNVLTILGMALKCADLSHLTKPWDEHRVWVQNLQEEMHRQGDKEKALNLPVSPGMDRHRVGIVQAQSSFIKAIAMPLYENMHSVFSNTEPLLRGIKQNLNQWSIRTSLDI